MIGLFNSNNTNPNTDLNQNFWKCQAWYPEAFFDIHENKSAALSHYTE